MGARVFQLVPAQNEVATFEEAFGEYSEARGRGRERRKKRREERKERKLERIADRQEVKQARIAARDEVKEDRQERRIGRRQKRKSARQAIRTEQAEARQARRTGRLESREGRRMMRTEGRMARKAVRRPQDEELPVESGVLEQGLDEGTPQEMGGYGEQDYAPQGESSQTYNDETQGYSDQGYDQGYDQGGYDQGGYSDQSQGGGYSEPQYGGGEGGYDYGPEESAPYEDEYYNEEPYGDGYYEEPTSEGEYNEEGNYVGDESGYLADYDTGENFEGKPVDVDPEIQSAVDKLAWNAECVRRLEKKRKLNPNQAQAISQKILAHKKRYNELKSSLDDYSECCGDYSSADGLEPKRRKIMVKRAWKISQGKIKNAGRPMKPMVNRPADDVVPVAADLKPSFSPNRIVVPGEMKSSYSGTGLNGLDLQNDFDAPDVREVFLGADGSKSGISWGSVLVGVGVGVAAVWAINKYKLLK